MNVYDLLPLNMSNDLHFSQSQWQTQVRVYVVLVQKYTEFWTNTQQNSNIMEKCEVKGQDITTGHIIYATAV
jgi:hypothetical protein